MTAAFVILSFWGLMSACGGGGGGSSEAATSAPSAQLATTDTQTNTDNSAGSSSTVSVVDYSPDGAKLNNEAETSLDLYVESDFNFDSYRQITLDIDLQSLNGENIADSLVYISAIASGVVALDDPKVYEKSLITVLKTDSDGSGLITFEAPQVVDNLLIEINSLGIHNKHIVDISEQDYFVLALN